jgi:hypothetical protein
MAIRFAGEIRRGGIRRVPSYPQRMVTIVRSREIELIFCRARKNCIATSLAQVYLDGVYFLFSLSPRARHSIPNVGFLTIIITI